MNALLNIPGLLEYRRKLQAEYQQKLAAIDVLLGRSSEPYKTPGKMPELIHRATKEVSEPFTIDSLVERVEALGPEIKTTHQAVNNALWRLVQKGKYEPAGECPATGKKLYRCANTQAEPEE